MSKYIYKIQKENGDSFSALDGDEINFKMLTNGNIRLYSEVPLSLGELKVSRGANHHWSKKKEPMLIITQPENMQAANEIIENKEPAMEQAIPAAPEENPNEIHIGNKIEINLAGNPTECTVLQTFEEQQEIKVQIKNGGGILVVPADWFIRKI